MSSPYLYHEYLDDQYRDLLSIAMTNSGLLVTWYRHDGPARSRRKVVDMADISYILSS